LRKNPWDIYAIITAPMGKTELVSTFHCWMDIEAETLRMKILVLISVKISPLYLKIRI
jgi:hypothetical protein